MKNCLSCGAEASDDAAVCDQCGHEFVYRGSGSSKVVSGESVPVQERPDGSMTMTGGGLAIAMGLLLVFFAFTGNDANASVGMLVAGGALAQLGLTFWLAGYVVRAISFLPGKVD